MPFYIRTVPGHVPQAWKIDGGVALRLGITNPESGPGSYFKADAGEDVWDVMKRSTPWFLNGENPFSETVLPPGYYYPRIARPIDQHPHESPGWSPGAANDTNFIAEARTQLIVLSRQLDRICRTVHPDKSTMNAFGHDIRNLLILASTEVENHWRGVLGANGVHQKRFDTTDYVKLVSAMALGQYEVSFKVYPWLTPFRPFDRWGTSEATTKDLPWYAAYNETKHNRAERFGEAKLVYSFEAVSACAVMMAAQFGLPELMHKSSDLQEMFHFVSTPAWPLTDIYTCPYGEVADWRPSQYPFERR